MKKLLNILGYLKYLLTRRWFWIVVVVGVYTYAVVWFFSSYSLRSPILFQSPIVRISDLRIVKNAHQSPKKAGQDEKAKSLSEKEIVLAVKHGEILWNIYQLESGRGKNDSCRNTGRGFAGFGVLENGGKIVCYDSFEKAVERASFWLGQLHPEQGLDEALCAYNTGVRGLMECEYSNKYHNL